MQTATSDVLKVISRSAFNLQAVFNTLVTSAVELGDADWHDLRARRRCSLPQDHRRRAYERARPISEGSPSDAGTLDHCGPRAAFGKVERIPDRLVDPEVRRADGFSRDERALPVGVPLLRKEGVEGRSPPRRAPSRREITDRQIEIVQTFADQVVIALETVRLFDEVQVRTRELAASLMTCGRRRIASSSRKSSLPSASSPPASPTRSRTRSISSTVSSALSREPAGELADVIKAAPLDDARRGEAEELIGTIEGELTRS